MCHVVLGARWRGRTEHLGRTEDERLGTDQEPRTKHQGPRTTYYTDSENGLAACGATPSAFERRCIPGGCVAPPSNIPDILASRVLPAGASPFSMQRWTCT